MTTNQPALIPQEVARSARAGPPVLATSRAEGPGRVRTLLELHGQNLKLHPHLLPGWDALEFQVLLHDVAFRFRVLPDRVTVRAQKARGVRVGNPRDWIEVGADGVELEHDARGWRSTR